MDVVDRVGDDGERLQPEKSIFSSPSFDTAFMSYCTADVAFLLGERDEVL